MFNHLRKAEFIILFYSFVTKFAICVDWVWYYWEKITLEIPAGIFSPFQMLGVSLDVYKYKFDAMKELIMSAMVYFFVNSLFWALVLSIYQFIGLVCLMLVDVTVNLLAIFISRLTCVSACSYYYLNLWGFVRIRPFSHCHCYIGVKPTYRTYFEYLMYYVEMPRNWKLLCTKPKLMVLYAQNWMMSIDQAEHLVWFSPLASMRYLFSICILLLKF